MMMFTVAERIAIANSAFSAARSELLLAVLATIG
jgi:hypothetical protein